MSRPEKKEITTNLSQVSSAEVIASTSQLNTDSEGMAIIPRNASFSSVEIEPSTSENSRRSNRVTRSQSLSRTLIRSFRRKKKSTHSDESAGEKNQIGDTNDSRITGANETPGGETVEKDAVPKSGEEQSKISRILRMNSISRFKLRRNKSVSSLNDASNVKRSTSLVNFFRREKKEKVCATVDAEITTTECQDQLGTKKSRLRDSMRRFRSNKSSSTSTEDEEGAATSASEKNRWRPRRSISMFGSSFNLKKIFHSEPVSEEVADDITNQDPILGAMKRSESSRQKLSQLTSTPGEVGATSEGCNDSEKTRRNSIGEKLKAGRNLFKRDSFILKKSSTSKTSNPVEEPTEETSASSEILIENDTNLGQEESQPTSNSHKLDEDKQAVADDDSHNSSKLQIQQQISGTSQLELKNHQEKPCEETNQTKEAKTVTQEANVVVSQEREDRQAENRHGHNLEAEKSQLKIGLGFTDCPQQEKQEDFLNSQDSIADQLYVADIEMPANLSAVRMVALRKSPGEPLGLTVKSEDGQLVVARILGGGAVDRQGLLHVGDIIGEVNGVVVRSAEQLQVEIARCKENIQLKVLPSFHEIGSNGVQSHVRAHFDYDPKEDKLLPCPEIGLAFKKGDILQVVNQSDPNWWQAKKVGWSGPAGLIPSQELEERRKAYVAPEADFVHKIGFCGTRISKKKKKTMYQIKSSVDLDKAELLLYEEVTRMPPFRRKSLVLIGSEGIGRRTLKNRLINSDPDRFGTTMPHTSRPMRELEEDGMGYWFVSREEMEHDIRDHQFLECGEHNGHLYGTKLDTIRTIIRQGKMCVLDCSPNALKILHNSPEFMPYVIFLAAPGMEHLKEIYANSRYSSRNLTFDRSSSIRFSSRRARTLESLTSLYEEEDFKNALEESARIQRTYDKYFDQIITNDDPDVTFRKVVEALEVLSNQHQWVPVSWVY